MTDSPGAIIELEDGTRLPGKSFGFHGPVAGELVFNTAMTGYPESLTDPSYKGQILLITYPLVGNYGVPGNATRDGLPEFFESGSIHAAGLVISDYSFAYNHWNAVKSLGEWLKEEKIPGVYGLDTRALTKMIRDKGSMKARIITGREVPEWFDPNAGNLVDEVSLKEKKIYGNGSHRILLIDCGVKNNIIRYLLKRDTTVVRVPWDHDFSREDYDGLFITNGPGDPATCVPLIENLGAALRDDRPVFGICLGHQLVALASGAQTFKLKFGHRSHNQPVMKEKSKRAYITSQNHGFAVDKGPIGRDWEPSFTNLNDGTNEGIRHLRKPIFTTQFHPEASGGPTDTSFLFDEFIELIRTWKKR